MSGADGPVRTRVKICGITRLEDAYAAANAGADAIGFVFVRKSARYIEPAAARRIADRLPAFVTSVGLFLDAPTDEVRSILDRWPALVPQFHGRESAADCDAFGRPYLKALPMGGTSGATQGGAADGGGDDGGDGGLPTAETLAAFTHATGFLFDSHAPGELGGTGHAFDWDALAAGGAPGGALGTSAPLILAGGLDASNVGAGIARLAPWAVDVSSGVESAKGIKDPAAIRSFMNSVQLADRHAAETHAPTTSGRRAG